MKICLTGKEYSELQNIIVAVGGSLVKSFEDNKIVTYITEENGNGITIDINEDYMVECEELSTKYGALLVPLIKSFISTGKQFMAEAEKIDEKYFLPL